MTEENRALTLVRMGLMLHYPNDVDLDADGNMIVSVGNRDFLVEMRAFEVTE